MFGKRSICILTSGILGLVFFGYLVFDYRSSIGRPGSIIFAQFVIPLIIIVSVGVVVNLLALAFRKNILIIIVLVLYNISIIFVGYYLVRFSLAGMTSAFISFFTKYMLPIFPSTILCIIGLVRHKKIRE